MQDNEIDVFNARIIKNGSSCCVIIPKNQMDFSGLKEGDILKVWFKKLK